MKKVLVILGVFFVVGVMAGLVAAGTRLWSALTAPAKAADAFFAVIEQGDHAGAVELLAPALRAVTSPEQLAADVEALGLRSRITWSKWNRDLSSASLQGKAQTATGEVTLAVRMVKEAEAWRVEGVGKVDAEGGLALPSAEEQAALARASSERLRAAVRSKDFAPLVRSMWQGGRGTSVEEFQRGFNAGVIRRMRLLDRLTPTIVPATAMNSPGIIEVKSIYSTLPSASSIGFEYAHDGLGWRLGNVSLNGPDFVAEQPAAGATREKPRRPKPARPTKRPAPVEIAKI